MKNILIKRKKGSKQSERLTFWCQSFFFHGFYVYSIFIHNFANILTNMSLTNIH